MSNDHRTPAGSFVPGEGDPSSTGTFLVLVIGSILVLLVVIALQGVYYRERDREFARKNFSTPPQELALVRAEQREKLSGYHWVDKTRGVVAIPIQRAMEFTVAETPAGGR